MSRLILAMAVLGALSACSAAARPSEEMASAAPSVAAVASAPALAGGPVEPAATPPAAAFAAPAPAAHAPVHAALADVRCSIRTRRTSHGVELEAFARSNAPAMGEYEFIITKEDAGGSSDIVQGGAFDLNGGGSQSLGLSEISVERGGRYRARLVLSDSGGVICREEVRS
jgi:hypothetical protein